MATPRGRIVDDEAVGTYHCISRCVRKAMLCGEGLEHRRTWIENRIADLQGAMAIDLTAWHVMANHMHLVVTTRPDIVREWSDREESSKSRTPTDHELPRDFPSSKSRTPTDHELPRDFPGDAFAMATLASRGASEQKAAKHGDTTRTHRR